MRVFLFPFLSISALWQCIATSNKLASFFWMVIQCAMGLSVSELLAALATSTALHIYGDVNHVISWIC